MATTTPEITLSSTHGGGAAAAAPPDVSTPTPEYLAMEQLRLLPRYIMGGTPEMRTVSRATSKAADAILPQEQGESDPEYQRRVARTVLVNLYKESVQGLVARVFSRALQLDETAPAAIRGEGDEPGHWENIDLSGRHGDTFLKDVAEDAVAEGMSYVFVDYPRVDGRLSAAAERELGVRPFWTHVPAHRVIDATVYVGKGAPVLLRARIRESVIEPDGPWGTKKVEQVRVLYRGNPERLDADGASVPWVTFEVYRQVDDEWVLHPGLGGVIANQKEIPLVPFYAGRVGQHLAEPPLLNLAYLQLQHYQKKSDLDNILHVVNVPALMAAGFDNGEIEGELEAVEWGPFRVIASHNPNASIRVVEHNGRAIAAAQDDIGRLEDHIRVAALEPMTRKASGEEKSTIRMLEDAKAATRLQAWALSWMHSATQCLEFHARYLGQDKGGSVSVPKEVFKTLSALSNLEYLRQLAMGGHLSTETLLEAVRRADMLWEDFEIDAELERIHKQKAAMLDMRRMQMGVTGAPDESAEDAPGVPNIPDAAEKGAEGAAADVARRAERGHRADRPTAP